MLLLSFFSAAFAGGPPQWNPTDHPLETTTPPITVHAVQMGMSYTRLEITNNSTKEMSLTILTGDAAEHDSSLRILPAQAEALCQHTVDDVPTDTPDYPECNVTMPPGQQLDVVIVYMLKEAPEDTFAKVTVVAMPATDLPEWAYYVQKPIVVTRVAAPPDPADPPPAPPPEG